MGRYLNRVISILLSIHSLLHLKVQSYSICGGVQNRYVCDINNPQSFHICLGDNKHTLMCPSNLHFNARIQICDWPSTTLCPYDNYSGEDDVTDTDGDDSDDIVASSRYLSESASKSREARNMRSPYLKSHQGRREETHSHSFQGTNVRTTHAVPVEDEYDTVDVSQKYEHRGYNDLVTERFQSPIQNEPHRAPRKLQKRRRKGNRIRNRTNAPQTLDATTKEEMADENVPTKNNRFLSGRQPHRSLSPYAPPSEAYNGYNPSFRTQMRQNKFRMSSSSLSSQAASKSHEKKNHQNSWYEQPFASEFKGMKSLSAEKIDSPVTNRAKFSRKSINNKDKKTKHTQAKPTPYWMRGFNDQGRSAKSDNSYNLKPNVNNDERNKKNYYKDHRSRNSHKSVRSQSVESTMSQRYPPFSGQRATLIGSSTGQMDAGKSWAQSLENRKPVRHPQIRPYRPLGLRLGDWVDHSAVLSSYKNSDDKPTSQMKQSPSKPIISANGDVIHPYKPNQRVSPGAPPKYLKSYFEDSKLGSYFSKWSKNKKRRGKCSTSWCKLPKCRCIGSDIPGGLPRADIPMMVMLTFDDGVNHVNFPYYQDIFDGSIRNPNGCPIKGTFFVSGDSTNYEMVKQLSKDDHEIASHTLSHRSPTTWWAHAGVENWETEVMGMKNRLAEKANVPLNEIKGMRAPFLQVGGNDQYVMLSTNKFRYDSSMVTGSIQRDSKPPIWPFTLDTPPDSQTCNLTPCPTKSYPGLWEIPLIRWYGNTQVPCAMPDSCSTGYGYDGTMAFLEDNFQRHYKSNKAPLGIFIHASWFKRKGENFEALKDFISSLVHRGDVWMLTASQVLDWIEEPHTLSSLNNVKSWQC